MNNYEEIHTIFWIMIEKNYLGTHNPNLGVFLSIKLYNSIKLYLQNHLWIIIWQSVALEKCLGQRIKISSQLFIDPNITKKFIEFNFSFQKEPMEVELLFEATNEKWSIFVLQGCLINGTLVQ